MTKRRCSQWDHQTRAFATLLDGLKRYRHGGEQRVVVQHVNVNDGGQAIVGTIEAPDRSKQPEAMAAGATAALPHAAHTPMPILAERQADPAPRERTKKAKANGRKRPPHL